MDTSSEGSAKLHPWLVIHDVSDRSKLVWYNIASKKYSQKTITEMENKLIWCSRFGWFILQDITSADLCLFDPITLEIIGLPPLPKDCGDISSCHILLPLGNPNCHAIFFIEDTETLFYCKPKDGEFTKLKVEDIENFRVVGGKGYALLLDKLAFERCLVEVAFESEGSEVAPLKRLITMPSLPLIDFRGSLKSYSYLVELGGELLLVDLLKNEIGEIYNIVIWKLDSEKKKFIEIDDIGSWTIFISSNIAIAQENSALRKNAVYFLKENDRFVCVFNMIDGSFSMIFHYSTVSREYFTFDWMFMDTTHPF
ncbi:hypothetical protein M5689_012244 [Euphorbia peplus]|nr:hypothetical protein M5689_012244 [Euphorbia peplus]